MARWKRFLQDVAIALPAVIPAVRARVSLICLWTTKKKKQRLLLKRKQRINRKGKDYERINIINYQCRYR